MDPNVAAVRFNEAINEGDLDALAALMTADHIFVDAAGETVSGRERCVDAWRSFFEQFPVYENVFESVAAEGGRLTMVGHSNCPDERLDGPAVWTAEVRGGRVAEWRVYDDTPEIRIRLGIGDDPL